MQTVYLDRNVILDSYLERNPQISSIIATCKAAGDIFPYSPAHVEEIVGARHTHGIKDSTKQLQFINALSGGMAFCPSQSGDTLLQHYDVEQCRANVEDGYGRNLTEHAKQCELDRLKKNINSISLHPEVWNNIREEVAQCTWETVFSNQHILKFLTYLETNENLRITMETFYYRMSTVEELYNILDLFGFRREENERHVENRMHDITHTIYASSADIFVTNDGRLKDKAKAIYCITSTATLVMTPGEFITYKLA